MDDLFIWLGIALVLKGVLYALMPDGMKRLMLAAIQQSSGALRTGGLALAIVGLGVVVLRLT
jgi:uncharacterized protein YjeT (DUF2065 family)